jgi:hypothetical protein
LIKKTLLKSIKELEKTRSKFIVEKFRAEQTEHQPHVEVPSNVIQKRNYQDSNSRNFDETCHHRDYNVVRTEPSKPIRVRDVRKEAIEQDLLTKQRLSQKTQNLVQFKKLAQERYTNAITTVGMDQRKIKLFHEMKDLEIEDRSRKQVNASMHASTFKSHYVHSGQDHLTRMFQSQFQIGYTNGTLY